mgnify:FL=1
MTDEPLTYGPDMFASDVSLPDPATVLNEPLPRAWTQGGMIEAVKRAVITGLRSSFGNSSLTGGDQKFYIDIEYPTEPTSYPGIWVQSSIANLTRAGLSKETWTKDDDGNWGSIQEWSFNGNITLTVAALTSKDRDRLSDTVIAQLAFARPPDLIIYNPKTNANQMKGLITALDQNPYVSMTVNTDVIQSGGETVTGGTPWAQNILLYENNFSLTCHGQFNLRFSHDGVYSLAEIRHNHVLTDDIPPDNSHDPNRPPRDPRWV